MGQASLQNDRAYSVEASRPKGFGILFENPYLFGVALVNHLPSPRSDNYLQVVVRISGGLSIWL